MAAPWTSSLESGWGGILVIKPCVYILALSCEAGEPPVRLFTYLSKLEQKNTHDNGHVENSTVSGPC